MKCRLCGSEHTFKFLDLGSQPLANKYPTQAQFAIEDFFPLEMFFCLACRNVQLGTVISRERMFSDYYYLSSVNGALVRHFETLASKLAGANLVVDVGSNDGILLKPLKALGIKAVGVEPSVNVSKIANDQGLTTICSFFDQATAAAVAQAHGKADVIVASSVFTHLEDPHQFIEAVKTLLTDDGKFIIEVEYLGSILDGIQFERFYLDRIFYYSLTSLKRLFEAHEMTIVDVAHIEPHGGSLQVWIAPRMHASATASVEAMLQEEAQGLVVDRLKEFAAEVDAQIAVFRGILADYRRRGLRVGGYGAPARVSTICNYGAIGPDLVEFIVDDSPLKQSKHTPGTHIPIVTKAELERRGADVLVVFAYEYFDDIRNKTGGAYRYLLPIPPKEIV